MSADLEFFWDPICPWAWLTSRWVVNVLAEQPMDVDWKFICLRYVNEDKEYGSPELPAQYEAMHMRGLKLLRVAAAVREKVGREAMLPLYTAYGTIMHNEQNADSLDDPANIEDVLAKLELPTDLVKAAESTEYDEIIRNETQEALDRCGGNIGTPVLSFTPPDGPSFFGPVINKAPKGAEAVELYEAVRKLGENPHFSELKRSTRGRPEFDTAPA